MVQSQLFVDDLVRRYCKGEIQSFSNIFNKKLFPAFSNIGEEAEEIQEESYHAYGTSLGEDFDGGDAAEFAIDQGIDYYETMNLVKYSFTAISIATLYLLWEQQVRRFLFKEMVHVFDIKFSDFCAKRSIIEDIKKHFLFHRVDLHSLKCWNRIDELRLLCHVIKHGDGKSAKQLFAIRSDLFKRGYDRQSYAPSLDTTLLEETLNLSQTQFNEYAEILASFWDELPERSYSDHLQ